MSKLFTASNIFRSYKSINSVPAGFFELSYLESTGQQYIDTMETAKNGDKIVVDVERLYDTEEFIFGSKYTKNCFEFDAYFSNNSKAVIEVSPWNNSGGRLTADAFSGERLTIIVSANERSIYTNDGTCRACTTINPGCSPDRNIFIFRLNGNTYSPFGRVRIFSFKWFRNNALIMDLIPSLCLCGTNYFDVYTKEITIAEKNIIGLFDKINRSFYTNKGTEQFLF